MNSKIGNSLAIVVTICCSAWRAILPGCLGALIYRSLWERGFSTERYCALLALTALPTLFGQVKQVKQIEQSNQSKGSSVWTMVVLWPATT